MNQETLNDFFVDKAHLALNDGLSFGKARFVQKRLLSIRNLISVRKNLPVMSRGDFTLVKTKSPSNFSYIRSLGDEKILVINNLSGEKLIAEITIPISVVLDAEDNKINSFKNLIYETCYIFIRCNTYQFPYFI